MQTGEAPPLEWEELGGCALLRPQSEARGVVHFCGGLVVSPSPQIAYRYFLESLAQRGYVILATSYAVDLDYSKPAAEILHKFESAKSSIPEYSSLPLFAVGHSLGALMQVLMCSNVTSYASQCSGSALISFNNKPIDEAVPLFKELFVPALTPYGDIARLPSLNSVFEEIKVLRRKSFQLARDVITLNTEGNPLEPQLLRTLSDAEAIAELGDQVPQVLSSIAMGKDAFTPTPAEVKELIRDSFPNLSPLIVSFTVDSLDESPSLESALSPSVDAQSLKLQGTHLTPLAVDPDSSPLPEMKSVPSPFDLRGALLSDADSLVDALDKYFEERSGSPSAASQPK